MKIFYASLFLLFICTQVIGQGRSSGLPGNDPAPKVLKFYPNPAVTYITFEFLKDKDNDKNYTFQLYNLLGRKVYETTNLSLRTTVNLNDFFRGVYIFQLKDKSGKVIESGKFQVSK